MGVSTTADALDLLWTMALNVKRAMESLRTDIRLMIDHTVAHKTRTLVQVQEHLSQCREELDMLKEKFKAMEERMQIPEPALDQFRALEAQQRVNQNQTKAELLRLTGRIESSERKCAENTAELKSHIATCTAMRSESSRSSVTGTDTKEISPNPINTPMVSKPSLQPPTSAPSRPSGSTTDNGVSESPPMNTRPVTDIERAGKCR